MYAIIATGGKQYKVSEGDVIKVEKIDAEAQEDLTMKYGIRQAPTLIVTDGDGYESFVNLSNIKKFIEQC